MQSAFGVLPGQPVGDPLAAGVTHRRPCGRVVEQLVDVPREELVIADGKRAAGPAETRDSGRSKETIGRPSAMYSMILIMVEASLAGLGGSGARQTSAVDRTRSTPSLDCHPANVTASPMPSLRARSRDARQHLAVADQDSMPVVAPTPQRGECAERMVDPVLAAHHARIGQQEALALLQRRVRVHGVKAREVGAIAHDEDVTGLLSAPLNYDSTNMLTS